MKECISKLHPPFEHMHGQYASMLAQTFFTCKIIVLLFIKTQMTVMHQLFQRMDLHGIYLIVNKSIPTSHTRLEVLSPMLVTMDSG